MHECTIRFKLVHASTECASGSRSSQASYLSSTCSNGVSLRRFNILCCILISIVMGSALGAIPLTNVEWKSFNDVATRGTHLAGWEESVNYLFDLPIPFTFICEHVSEHTHPHIGYNTSKTVIGCHATHVQVFDANDIESANQVGSELVQTVRSAVTNVFMQPSYFDALSLPPHTTFLTSCENALQPCQLGEIAPKMFRVCNALTVRKGSQSTNPKVNSNSLTCLRKFFNSFIEAKSDKVSPRRFLDYRNRCRFALEFSTQLNVETTKTRKTQIFVSSVPFEGTTGVFSRLSIPLFFVCRVAAAFSPKVEEGSLQMSKRLLSWYTGYVIQPFCGLLFFERCEHCRSIVVADSLLFGSPSFGAVVEGPIINVAATTKNSGEFLGLGVSRIKPESISCFHTINILCVS